MSKKVLKLNDLRIPSKGTVYYYAYYTDNGVEKESLLSSNPQRSREINQNCPDGIDLFLHMKICLNGLFFENTEEGQKLMDRIAHSPEKNIEFGCFRFWGEDGDFCAVINNIDKEIFFKQK